MFLREFEFGHELRISNRKKTKRKQKEAVQVNDQH